MISAMTSKRTPELDVALKDLHYNETEHARAGAIQLHSSKSRKMPDSVHALLQQSPAPNLIIEHGRFIECNQAALQLLGLEAEEQLIGIQPCDCSPLRQVDGRLSSEKADEILSSALRGGSCHFEWRHVRKDSSIVPVEVTLTKLHLGEGEALYTTWRDLTDQESLRAALRESEALFRELFEQSEDAIILLDPATWRIIDVNPSAFRLYGYSKQSLLRGGIQLFMEAAESERFMKAVCSQSGTSGVRLEGCSHVTNDGKELLVTTKCRPVTFHSKALLYCRFRDTTHELRLQEEATLIENKLIHTNKMTSLGTLVSSVAHEINNPNNFIMLNSSLLNEAWVDVVRVLEDYTREQVDVRLAGLPFDEMKEGVSRLISGVMDGSRRINSLVDNLKGFSQQTQKSSKGPVNINNVIGMATSMLSGHIKKYTNNFKLILDETIPDIQGNSQRLEQVVINLILNALQALPSKESAVRVISRFEKEERVVTIRVEDEGAGIPADVLPRIREPFFSTKTNAGGTGLGVYISHSIVRGHNGSLVFESSEGQGTKAIITLPVVADEVARFSPFTLGKEG